MRVTVYGVKPYDRVGKDGRRYVGVDFWAEPLLRDPAVEGTQVDKYTVTQAVLNACGLETVEVAETYQVSTNKWDKVDDIIHCQPEVLMV